MWKDALSDLQGTLSIMELMAVVALFVDLVVRYDNIPKAWQTLVSSPWGSVWLDCCSSGSSSTCT